MALNYLFVGFFLLSFALCCVKAAVGIIWPEAAFGNPEIFNLAIKDTFDKAEAGFTIALGYAGVFTLWLGIMKVGEKGGVIDKLGRLVAPLFRRLFPQVPAGHPAFGAMMMNISANMLGLDNAATPLGIRAMEQLQTLNPEPEKASNAQIMFLVLNTSGLTIIPLSIMVLISELGQGTINPSEYFIPILITTFCSSMAGLIAVSLVQKLRLYAQPAVWAYLLVLSLAMAGLAVGYTHLGAQGQSVFTSIFAGGTILGFISWFVWSGHQKGINVYSTFIEGAKEGFDVAVKIVPYLVGILVAIGLFRVSGGLDLVTSAIGWLLNALGADPQIAEALPTALTKPFSGSGARAMMVETIQNQQTIHGLAQGMKTIPSRMVAIMQGSTETTFYVLAVYFGAVGIKHTRYAVPCGLLADVVGFIAAILLTYIFFAT